VIVKIGNLRVYGFCGEEERRRSERNGTQMELSRN
jgi:hypothetical protein